MTNVEIWKPIPGYLNYKVSNFGRVKSIQRLDARGERRKGRILKQAKNPRGYMMVTLYEDGKRTTVTVHKLVMSAFAGERPDGLEVNHIDENKNNNSLENLEYVTRLQNIHHGTRTERATRHMINNPRKSKRVIQYTLDGDFVSEYPSQFEAMRQTGICNRDISAACNGKRKHAGGYKWECA